jgi:hypothetical protein
VLVKPIYLIRYVGCTPEAVLRGVAAKATHSCDARGSTARTMRIQWFDGNQETASANSLTGTNKNFRVRLHVVQSLISSSREAEFSASFEASILSSFDLIPFGSTAPAHTHSLSLFCVQTSPTGGDVPHEVKEYCRGDRSHGWCALALVAHNV